MILSIAVLVVKLRSEPVVYKQHIHQGLQDQQQFVVHHIIMLYVQKAFAVVSMVVVVLAPVTVLIHSIVNLVMEIVILQRHHLVLQPSMILVQYLEVFLTARISVTA